MENTYTYYRKLTSSNIRLYTHLPIHTHKLAHTRIQVHVVAYAGSTTGTVTTVAFTTASAAAPVLSSVAVSSITKTGASLAATSDQNGFIYYSVLAAKASTPSAADVKTAGEATKAASTAASAATIVVSSLAAGTDYKVHRKEDIVVLHARMSMRV